MLAAFPLGFTAIFFRSELLQLFHPAFGVPFAFPLEELVSPALIACLQFEYLYEMGLTGFMIILTIVPLLSCGIGLAGNVITMTGHSGWNLFNSGVTAGLGIVTAALLIPEWGIFGAALAAAVSAVLMRSRQLVEVRFLIGFRLSPSRLYKPYLAALISGIFLFGLEPLTHGRIYWRVPLLLFSLAVYFIILKKLGLEDGDAKILLPWKKKPK
jgi:O-antigen/teichoic acid export membrane protein